MASFLKSLFGKLGGGGGDGAAAEGEAVEYNGYMIHPAPYSEGGQYQTAGRIVKVFEGGPKEHRFVRAEKHPSKEDAESFSVTKARQIIDEQGDRMFGP
jgi:hypothetical protein